MFAAVYGMTVLGLQAHLIRVEVDVANGLPCFEKVRVTINYIWHFEDYMPIKKFASSGPYL